MALYYLDPRQAGTGAAPDVDVYLSPVDGAWAADILTEPSPDACSFGPHLTEHAALAAAREAAGFGHVAERACDATQTHVLYHCNIDTTCRVCAWPRDAHKEGSN